MGCGNSFRLTAILVFLFISLTSVSRSWAQDDPSGVANEVTSGVANEPELSVQAPAQPQVESEANTKILTEEYLSKLAQEHESFVETLNKKNALLEELRLELKDIAKGTRAKSAPEVSAAFERVGAVWESAVDQLLVLFSDIRVQSSVQMPEANQVGDTVNLDIRRIELLSERTKLLTNLKVKNFSLLRDSGILRAQLLQKCDQMECERARGINQKNISTILREIRVVPLRLIAGALSKWIEVRSKFYSGIDGWIDISRQALIFVILLLIPFVLIRVLRWTSRRLDLLKRSLLARSTLEDRNRAVMALWIARLNPFIPSVGMIISIEAARSLIAGTDFAELSLFLFYFQVYFVYRVAKLLLTIVLEIVFATDSIESLRLQKSRIEKAAARISMLVFVEYVLLHLIKDTVRRALAYNLIANFIFIFNIGFVFYESAKWHHEINAAFAHRFAFLWQRWLKRLQGSSLLGRLLLPLMFLMVILYDVIKYAYSHLIRMDLVKRLLSEVLRKRLESEEREEEEFAKVPKDYASAFDYYLTADENIFVDRENSVDKVAEAVITDWVKGVESEDSLLIVGNRGMGKSTSIENIADRMKALSDCKLQCVLQKVPPRILEAQDLFQWLSKVLGSEVKSHDDISDFDRQLSEKLVICLDDLHNLFLGVVGGFNAYRTFLDLLSRPTKNLFWCMTVNSRSWTYLTGVFGQEHYYGQVLTLKSWTDIEIQKLILMRHETTHYSRRFDESIKAYGAGENFGQKAESQFFRLLWGQSRGNPRSALMHWMSAISSPAPQQIYVGIPSFVSSGAVANMSDDSLILLSAIARHESLNLFELHRITGIHENIIRKCLKDASEKNLVWQDDHERTRISSKAQYVIDYFLTGKNFLYE